MDINEVADIWQLLCCVMLFISLRACYQEHLSLICFIKLSHLYSKLPSLCVCVCPHFHRPYRNLIKMKNKHAFGRHLSFFFFFLINSCTANIFKSVINIWYLAAFLTTLLRCLMTVPQTLTQPLFPCLLFYLFSFKTDPCTSVGLWDALWKATSEL